jgi:hypothetical protein
LVDGHEEDDGLGEEHDEGLEYLRPNRHVLIQLGQRRLSLQIPRIFSMRILLKLRSKGGRIISFLVRRTMRRVWPTGNRRRLNTKDKSNHAGPTLEKKPVLSFGDGLWSRCRLRGKGKEKGRGNESD